MMVKGIGIDIVEIERFRRIVKRGGRRFLEKIFTKEEIDYCFSMKDPYPHLAGRFCVKEAVLKSLGLGMGMGVKLKDIIVCLDKSGKPYINAGDSLKKFMNKVPDSRILISISHSGEYVVAVALLV